MMSDTQKNTPASPEVEVETDSIINDSVAQSEQLNKSTVGTFTTGEATTSNSSPQQQPMHWPGYYPGALPTVVVGQNTRIPELTEWSGQVLQSAHKQPNPHRQVYRRGNGFTRVVVTNGNEPKTELLDKDGMYGILARSARWARVQRQEKTLPDGSTTTVYTLETVDAPHKRLGDLMTWPDVPLPRLKGLSACPMVLSDGKIAGTQPGYDPQSAYWFTGTALPQLPSVEQARNILVDWLVDFPISEAGRANILGVLIANLLRPLLEYAGLQAFPGLALTATSPGSGKTLLAQCIGAVLSGCTPAMSAFPTDKEEWRKNITSWVLAGQSLQIYDNLPVNTALDSGHLAGLLTTGRWSDRLLGANTTLDVPVSAQVIMTGNNMHLSTELTRRVIVVHVTPDVDRPWKRTPDNFKHPNIIRYTLTHRGEILGALLSLIQHWVDIGRPKGNEIMGNYELLTQSVGGILKSAGMVGWLINADESSEKMDEERAVWLGLLETWHEHFQDVPITAGELFAQLDDNGMLSEIPWFTARDDAGKRRQLGRRIKSQLGAVIGPWKITEAGRERSGVPRYCLVTMAQPEHETHNEPSEVY